MSQRTLYLLLVLITPAMLAVQQLSQAAEIGRITVEAKKPSTHAGDLLLDTPSETGSRTGLTPFETPASVEIIDQEGMRNTGAKTISDALTNLPGVISGQSPAAPSSFSIRGFTRAQITFLRDGLNLGNTNMVMRPQNTCNLDRLELLRGPSSGMFGQGVVGGVVNAVVKKAAPQDHYDNDLKFSYGRWSTYEVCGGSGGPLSESAWYRFDISRYGSDGFIDDMDPESTNATGSILWQAANNFSVGFSIDHLDDDLANYWGTPLLPANVGTNPIGGIITTQSGEVIDQRTRRLNYNVSDQIAESNQTLARIDMDWQPNGDRDLRVRNTWYYFDAEREWFNAEGFIFNPATGLIDRTNGFFFVVHDQETWGTKLDVTSEHKLLGKDNTVVAGFEYQDIDFLRTRGFRFSPVPGDSVSVFNPVAGVYGPVEPRGVSPTDMDTWSVFLEDSLQVNERFSVLGGIRYENLKLVRQNFDLRPGREGQDEGSGFTRTFKNVGFRLGGVYAASENTNIYAQYSNAQDPANSNLFLVNNGEDVDLTDAMQVEFGVKSANINNIRGLNFTGAVFYIERDDVSQVIGRDSAVNVGGRESKGVELAVTYSPTRQIDFGANLAYVDAEFTDSVNFITFAGNTPPNVPDWTANAWLTYRPIPDVPLELGANLQYVGERYGTNANTVKLDDYTLLGLWARYQIGKLSITGRIKNVTDEDYVAWADVFYLEQNDPSFPFANQVFLGEPRFYEIVFEYKF